jgi:hypothetical protein
MRRLAKATRNDVYGSRRDYQDLIDKEAPCFTPKKPTASKLSFLVTGLKPGNTDLCGFGAYVHVGAANTCRVRIRVAEDVIVTRDFEVSKGWNRLGMAAPSPGAVDLAVDLSFLHPCKSFALWGVNCSNLVLPDILKALDPDQDDLSPPQICPETFFLVHDSPLLARLNADVSDAVASKQSVHIQLKKCSYCQRLLPVDPKRVGALAFHKHNAKKSKHQNECRACKKWRINDDFNPRRTTDQLHESSVITRERSLLLREPEILQAIKDRQGGAGLKSIVWRKFGKRCFRCDKTLELADVQLDHTRPLAYLWPIDEHATCLCGECNNFKKDKFPVDVYNDHQLGALAKFTGLSRNQLGQKKVNAIELARIKKEIVSFAREWSARTFNATARKVRELEPGVDLFDVLRRADPKLHKQVLEELANRPS